MSTRDHWNKVYTSKVSEEFSWYQETPEPSLQMLALLRVPLHSPIIDIGGGESRLVDCLLLQGYTDITVLDISEAALQRAQNRLNGMADKVNWIVTDINEFVPIRKYFFWHDRATFHFLTEENQIENYISNVLAALSEDGKMAVATFSRKGPDKCSGLSVSHYDETDMERLFHKGFTKLTCFEHEHYTTWNALQHFTFCGFEKTKIS